MGIGSKARPFGEGLGQAIKEVGWSNKPMGIHIFARHTVDEDLADFPIFLVVEALAGGNSGGGWAAIPSLGQNYNPGGSQATKIWNIRIPDIKAAYQEANVPLIVDSAGTNFGAFRVRIDAIDIGPGWAGIQFQWGYETARPIKDGGGQWILPIPIMDPLDSYDSGLLVLSFNPEVVANGINLKTGEVLSHTNPIGT